MTVTQQLTPEEIFDRFCNAVTFKSILSLHRQLCEIAKLKPTFLPNFYPKLKEKINSWKPQALWAKFDKRASHRCYLQGKACVNSRVLVIGCGPCGLRSAIEAQLLGAKVVVIEKRDRFSRHNVLHLWPFVIEDLRSLGAKKFFGKFCAGSIDHISIRQLQCILLKVALLLGVEVHENVGFEELIEPPEDQSVRTGWRARFSPEDHPVSQYEFDVLISADGKRNTLQGFPRKELRGRLAIAITANFVNRHTEAENRVEEISGVAFIFNQKFFRELNQATGIDLENIVYYKDETHYFVMTAKKHSLLNKGVIIHDYSDTVRLLSPENVNREALMDYAREAADFSTNRKLPRLEFAVNHYGNPDVAMFDFTSMFAAENASRVIERRGHKLLLQIIGDSLLEPFWPTGSGCARGFLGAFDACWALRSWASGRMTPLEVIAERESIYRLLAQTTPENLHKDHGSYALDPHTRYPNLNTKAVKPHQVRNLYDTDCLANLELSAAQVHQSVEITGTRKRIKRSESMVSPEALMSWLRKQVSQYPDIEITDSTSSFKDGRALCAIVSRYRPDLIDLANITPEKGASNCQLAFDVLQELGITPIMSGAEMAQCEHLDRLAMLSYLTQVYDLFRSEIPHVKQPKLDLEDDQEQEILPVKKAGRSLDVSKSGANAGTNSRRRTAEKGESREGTLRIGAERKGDTWRRNKMRRSAEKTLDRRYRRGASDTFNRKVLHLEAKFGAKSNPSSSEVQPQQQQEATERFPNVKSSRISVMAEKLFSQLATKDDIPKPAFKISNRAAGNLNSSSENCHFCQKRVYLMERMTAEGKTFHRGCFKCEYCSTMLRLGGYGFVRDEDTSGMFFCTAHLSMAYYMRAQLNKKKEDSTNTQVINEEINEKKIATESKTQHKRVMEEENYLRAGTPERVEFDNSFEILDESGDASVIDEDQWTDHNFGSSIVIDTEESSSEDEEEDADQDAKDDVFHDVEVLESLDLPNTGEESQSSGELSFDEDEEGESIPESWEDEELDEDLFNEEDEDEDFGENLEVLEQLEPGTLQSVSEASSGENSNDEILQESEEKPLESEFTIESGENFGTSSGTEGRLEVPVNLEPEEETLNLPGTANHGEASETEDPGTRQPSSGTVSAGTEETKFGEIEENDPEVSEPVETENVFVKIPEADLPHEESEEEKLDEFQETGTGKETGKDTGELEPVRGEVKRRSGRKFEPSPGFMRKKEVIYKDRERQSDLVRQMVLSKVPYQRTPDKTGSTPSLRDHETAKREARAKAQAMADSDLGLSPPDYIENLREKLRKKDPETPSVSEETPKSSRVNSEPEQQNERSSIYLWAGLSPTDCEKKFEMPATLRKDADKKVKNGERRRSFIQTIAGFFGVGSSNEDTSPEKTKNVKQKTPASKERLSIFKLGSSGKTKDKLKADFTDSASRDRSISSPVSPTAGVLDEDANRTRSSSLQCTPLSANASSVVTPGTKDSAASCSTPSKKQLKQIRQAARQAELKRLRMAQSIQRQLEEVEVKQKMLEEQGVKLEKTLRGENGGLGGKDEASLLQDWFQMVHEKNALARYEQELMVKARQLELEDRYARLQQELGEVKDSPSRNEEAIRSEMKDIDDQLNHLRSQQLQERQRYRDEDKKDLEARMLAKGFKLNSLRPPKDTK